MAAKRRLLFPGDAPKDAACGVEILANAVVTLGPKGRNVRSTRASARHASPRTG